MAAASCRSRGLAVVNAATALSRSGDSLPSYMVPSIRTGTSGPSGIAGQQVPGQVGLSGSRRPGELDVPVLLQGVEEPGGRQAPLIGHEWQRDQLMQFPRVEVPEGRQVTAHPVLRGGLARLRGRRLVGVGQAKHAHQCCPVAGAPAGCLPGAAKNQTSWA